MKLNKHIQIAAFLIASPFILTSCGDKKESADTERSNKTEAQANPLLDSYCTIATALYKDDLAAAQKAAAGIVKHDSNSALAASAKKLSSASDIAAARAIFNELSAAAIELSKNQSGYKVAHCPMANDGKGGDWLQKASDTQINNPYFGAAMAHCGSFKK